MQDPLFKNFNRDTLNQMQGPSEPRALCDCIGHKAMKPALQGINHAGIQVVKFMCKALKVQAWGPWQ